MTEQRKWSLPLPGFRSLPFLVESVPANHGTVAPFFYNQITRTNLEPVTPLRESRAHQRNPFAAIR